MSSLSGNAGIPSDPELDEIIQLAETAVAMWRQDDRIGARGVCEMVLGRFGPVGLGGFLLTMLAEVPGDGAIVSVNGPLEDVRDRVQAFLRAAVANQSREAAEAWVRCWDADDGPQAMGTACQLALDLAAG